MRLIKLVIVISVAILSISCSAQSNDQRPPKGERSGPPSFKELLKNMDANEDGKLAKAEIEGRLEKDFDKIDADKDGFITEEELKKAGPPKKRKKE